MSGLEPRSSGDQAVAKGGLVREPAAARASAAASATPGSVAGAKLRRALRCIVNAERWSRGLRPLRRSRRLATAARMHAADMVRRRYFAHERAGWTIAGRMQT